MTTTRDRGRDTRAASGGPRWDERSAFGTRGWPWWAAVVLALGLSVVGAVIDEKANADIATIFRAAFVIGCVAAVCVVRRRNLFGPMVQPPLILVVVVPVVAVALDTKPGSKVLVIGPQLINNFPVMAITTGVTVVLGAIRYLVQRRPVDDFDSDGPRRPEGRDRDRDRAPAGRDRDRDLDDRPGSRGGRPPSGGRGGQDRVPPRDRDPRRDPSRGRSSGDRGADRSGRSSSRDPRDRGRDPRDRDPRDRDPRDREPRGQARGRSPRDREPRREPRRRDDDY